MRALIFGSDGQDGYYLVRHLLKQSYQVYGIVRKKARNERDVDLQHITEYKQIFADLTDFSSIVNAILEAEPDEIYNLAGQSEIPVSWRQPSLTAEVNALGVTRILEAIRLINPHIRFFQASSSEMFGDNYNLPLNEESVFRPRNPYGTSKVFAHWIVNNYRNQYGLFACSGILFNHESLRRPPEFVTRKISKAVAELYLGSNEPLQLGDIYSVRDWGHASDYVKAMRLILQQEKPDDFVIATGQGHTVKEFVQTAFQMLDMKLVWQGEGMQETGLDAQSGKLLVKINPALCRNLSNDCIVGDPSKAKRLLGFSPKYSFEELVEELVCYDLNSLMEKRI